MQRNGLLREIPTNGTWQASEYLQFRFTETMGHGAYARYTDDFLIFGDDKAALHELREGIAAHIAEVRLEFAMNKTRVMATREGVPFCGFVFSPALRPRVLGATKRRFEARRHRLRQARDMGRLGVAVRSWYAFCKEGNTRGLRRAWASRRCLSVIMVPTKTA